MAFVFDLYAELLEVFPSPYIHIGGDECPRTEWLASAALLSSWPGSADWPDPSNCSAGSPSSCGTGSPNAAG